MKYMTKISSALALGTSLVLSVLAQTNDAQSQPSGTEKQAPSVPAYKPPSRGAPAAGRLIGGGSRGIAQDSQVVAVLAPEHTGLTTKSQPDLFWYLGRPAAMRLEFTLIEAGAVRPAAEIVLHARSEGMQRISLSQHGVKLKPRIDYEWSIALIQDPDQRSRDIVSRGAILFVEPAPSLTAKLDRVAPKQLPFVYAEEGMWYDAIAAISDLIDANPGDPTLKAQRAALLEQVSLKAIAADETRRAQAR